MFKSLQLLLELKRCSQKYGYDPYPVYLAPEANVPAGPVILRGWASTCDLDLSRTKIARYAFGLSPSFTIPLCYKHAEECGRVRLLAYKNGGLWCEVETAHPEAKRCGAFSISARVDDYTLMDADTPDFYAVIHRATLREISLTDRPCQLNALVMQRFEVAPSNEFFDLMMKKTTYLQQVAQYLIKCNNNRKDIAPCRMI